jgi:predicted nucleic acid-binding protein
MNAEELVFLDTNVLVYLFDDDAPKKQERAWEVFDLAASGDAITSTQVLQEFYVTVTRKLATPVPAEEAERVVRQLARLPIVDVDSSIILSAIGSSRRHQLSLWDALIVQAALAGGCNRLLTEDLQPGSRFESLTVENPFAD